MISLSFSLVSQETLSPAIDFDELRLTLIDIVKQTQHDIKTNNTTERLAMAGFNLKGKKWRDQLWLVLLLLNLKGCFDDSAHAQALSPFDAIVYETIESELITL